MKNPFYYGSGSGIENDDFCGRQREIKELRADIESGMNTLVYAARRFGKTALFHEVLWRERKSGRKGFYLDLFGVVDQNEFISRYFSEIVHSIEKPGEKAVRMLLGLFTSFQPKIQIQMDDRKGFIYSMVPARSEKDLALKEVMDLPFRLAEKHDETIVVMIDEFQEIVPLGLEGKFRAFASEHGRHVSYLFSGSKKSILKQMVADKSRPFYQSLKLLPLSGIPLRDWLPFVHDKFAATNRKIPDKIIHDIWELTQGCPYYFQRICYHVWKETPEGKEADRESLLNGLEQVYREVKDVYWFKWDSLTPLQKKIAKMAAEGLENIYTKDVLLARSLTASETQRGIKGLIGKDILDRDEKKLSFQDPFFRQWLRKIS